MRDVTGHSFYWLCVCVLGFYAEKRYRSERIVKDPIGCMYLNTKCIYLFFKTEWKDQSSSASCPISWERSECFLLLWMESDEARKSRCKLSQGGITCWLFIDGAGRCYRDPSLQDLNALLDYRHASRFLFTSLLKLCVLGFSRCFRFIFWPGLNPSQSYKFVTIVC